MGAHTACAGALDCLLKWGVMAALHATAKPSPQWQNQRWVCSAARTACTAHLDQSAGQRDEAQLARRGAERAAHILRARAQAGRKTWCIHQRDRMRSYSDWIPARAQQEHMRKAAAEAAPCTVPAASARCSAPARRPG